VSEWTIRKERVPRFDDRGFPKGLSYHKVWVVRFRGQRVAKYLRWDSALSHVCTYYRKFGERA